MIVIVEPKSSDYSAGTDAFLSSLGWTYLSHRFAQDGQELLLRLLTLSGIDPWSWERCAMHLVSQPSSSLSMLLAQAGRSPEPVCLKTTVHAIQEYARSQGEFVGEPPHMPAYLAAYGGDLAGYLADLEAVYGTSAGVSNAGPWQEAYPPPAETFVQPILLHRAMALMGATAGAIEQLMAVGGGHGHRD